MPVKHHTQTVQSESAASGDISATAWNESHDAPPGSLLLWSYDSLTSAWAIPSAATEFGGASGARGKIDLTFATEARIAVNIITAGVTTAHARLQYSTDASTWNYLDGGTGPDVTLSSAAMFVSSWITLVSGAKADVHIRPIGISGNGSTQTTFGNIYLQYR